jgi:hypothetical protein
MRSNRRNSKQKFDVFKLLSLLLVLIFVLLIPTIIQKLIKIKTIDCVTQYETCPDEFGFSLYLGSDYKIAKKEIEKSLNNNIQVNNYLLQYKIPSTIKIEINIKKSKYVIKNLNNNYYLVGSDGLVLNVKNESNLPLLVRDDAQYKVADIISTADKFALDLIEKVAWLYSISSARIEGTELKLVLNEGKIVRFPLEGDTDLLVGSLRLIFSRLNEEKEGIRMNDIREIDLRFKNPVLR